MPIILVKNTSENIGPYQSSSTSAASAELEWFNWSIYLETVPPEFIDNIESVTYHLHPSFKMTKINRTNHSDGFRLDSRGWGEFNIKLEINLKNGKSINCNHWLSLSESNMKKKQTAITVTEEFS
jgi:transcription initiation factor IIF auxiliary subunit